MKSPGALAPIALAAAVACAVSTPISALDAMGNAAAEPFTPHEYAAAVQETIAGYTVRATVGPANTPLPLALSNFLLDHPDLSAFIVNRRKIAPYKIVMRGPVVRRPTTAKEPKGSSISLTRRKRGAFITGRAFTIRRYSRTFMPAPSS